MSNEEYAAEMRKEADKWMNLMPVTKKLWLEIAERIEASADPKGSKGFKWDNVGQQG